MSDLSERILHRLRVFADRTVRREFTAAVEEHYLPLPIIRPFGTEILETRADVIQDLESFWGQWEDVGVNSIAPELLQLRSFTYGASLADIEWVLRRADGTEVALLHTSYAFREEGERLGISAIFSHDEMLQRPIYGKTNTPGRQA